MVIFLYHKLPPVFKSEANNYNLEIHSLEPFDQYNFFSSVQGKIVKYDAIFIDEVQDYDIVWLRIVKDYFLAGNEEFVVFGDEKQNIYKRILGDDKKPETNVVGRWSELHESYRLTTQISELSLKFQKHFFKGKYDIDDIQIIQQKVLLDVLQEIKYFYFEVTSNTESIYSDLYDLIHEAQAHPNDIGVLATRVERLRELDYIIREKGERTKTTFETKERYENLRAHIIDDDRLQQEIDDIRTSKKFHFWMNPGVIKLSTIHSFKGWEIHTLFLIIDDKDTGLEELIYTGITRCRYNIVIINIGNQMYDQFFQDALFTYV